MKRRIIVPLDGSEAAESALAFAAALAGERITLLACIPYGYEFLDRSVTGGEDALSRTVWESTRAYLEQKSLLLHQPNREVEILVESGDPAETILRIVTADDLIVMTTHGAGAGQRVIFGSVADRVVRHATCPVLVVRGGQHPVEVAPIRRIVVPLDGSDRSETALPLASEIADELSIPVRLLRVLDVELLKEVVRTGTYAAATYAASVDEIRTALTNYIKEQSDRLNAQGITTTGEVLDGSAAAALLAAVVPGDLIVMTSHGRGGIRRWVLGSVADKLVRSATVPVLISRAQ